MRTAIGWYLQGSRDDKAAQESPLCRLSVRTVRADRPRKHMLRGSELARRGTGASMRPAHGAPVASEGPSGLPQEWAPAALEPRFSVPDSMDRPLPTPTNARVFVKILTRVVQSNTFQSLRLRLS
jgi:hypothetical protein